MSNLREIETAISQLSPDELAALRDWFAKFDAEMWDRQFEADVAAGRLNKLAEQARQHLKEGRCTDMWDIVQLLIFGITIDNYQVKFKT